MNYGYGIPQSEDAMRAAACTQQWVWEYINANIDGNAKVPDRESWNGSYMSTGHLAEWLARTEGFYSQYHGNTSFNGTNNRIMIGDEVSITDTNGRLSSYASFSQTIDGITFSHSQGSNELNISVSSDTNANKVTFNSRDYGLWQLMPNGANYDSSSMSNYIYVQFTNGAVQNLMFSNYVDPSAFSISVEVISGKIEIIKEDSETGKNTQGDATFLNAEYQVLANEDIYNTARTKKFYSKGDLVATRLMNANGTTTDVEKLPLGKYLVKEVSSSEGYLLDKNEYEVDLTNPSSDTNIIAKTVTSYEVVKKMQVHIFKSGIKENSGVTPGLEGAEFTIKLYSDVIKAQNAGYSYAEIWSGIDEDGNKVEVNTERVNQAQIIAPTYEKITTDEDGNAYTKKLPYGKFICKESFTPKDFESAEDFTFSITEDESEIEEIAKKVKDIIVNNEQLETYIKLIKKDSVTGKTVSLNSATFQIKAKTDIVDRATGKIVFKAGEIVSQKIGNSTYTSFTTNSNNIVIPTNSYNNELDVIGSVLTPLKLGVGSYEIFELNVPQGFLQLENPIQFKVEGIRDYDTDKDGDFIKTVEIINEKPTGTLIIDKSVAVREDVNTSLVDLSDLSGIEFKITAKENIIDMADGSTIYEDGQEVKIFNLDKEGNYILTELPMGTYELQEVKTIDGLVLNTTKYEVKFEQKDLVKKVYEETKQIKNDTTVVEFSKTDITGEEELEGATLTVLDEEGNIIDTWISSDRTHKIEGLKVDETYVLREDICPENYVKSTDIKFKVKNTNEIQKVTMIDKILEIIKTDLTTGEELEGAELKVIDEDGNVIDEWTSSKEPHIVNGLEEGKKYKLIEITSPYGFEIAEEVEFEVTTDKETQIVEMKDMPILTDIRLIKIDSSTHESIKDKFTFGIFADNECTQLIQQVEANSEDGYIDFKDLRYGQYFVKELSAPNNYLLSDKVIKVDVNDIGVFVDDQKIEKDENGIYSFEFENIKIETPNTGDNSNIKFWIKVLSISFILLVIFVVLGIKKLRK